MLGGLKFDVDARQKEIDVSQLSCNELKLMLERLGEDDHPNSNTSEPTD